MEVKGRDPATECYRIHHEVDGRRVTALVPERFAADPRLAGERPSHESAYSWMAMHKTKIETAIDQLARGQHPRPPYDEIALVEES